MTTPKGDAGTRDTLVTFRKHLLWALVFGVPLASRFVLGHDHVSMRVWSVPRWSSACCPWRSGASRCGARGTPRTRRCRRPSCTCAPCPTCPPSRGPLPLRCPCRRRSPRPRPVHKPHRVVRFDRRPAPLPVAPPEPVRVPAAGRPKNHVVVRFDPPEQHEPNWQVLDQAERELPRQPAALPGAARPPGGRWSARGQRADARRGGAGTRCTSTRSTARATRSARALVDARRAGGHAGQRDPRGAAAHRQGADDRRLGQRPRAVRGGQVRDAALGPGDRRRSSRSTRRATCSAPVTSSCPTASC